MKLAMAVCSVAAAFVAVGEEWSFEVEAEAPRVVTCAAGRDWPTRMAAHGVAAVRADGTTTPVPWTLDTTGEQPELVFLADGHRRFTLIPRTGGSRSCATGSCPSLSVTLTNGEIAVRNDFFALRHPAKGGGGLPGHVLFPQSGQRDDRLFFYDRLVRRNANGGLDQFLVKSCADATARIILNTPLRAVVEATTTLQGVRISYRYVYTAGSPVVHVETRHAQGAGADWSEIHTLHASWPQKSPRYTHHLGNWHTKPVPIQKPGEKGKGFGGNWLAYTDGTNAVAVAADSVTGWDASSEFVYYLVAGRGGWNGRSLSRTAQLYFGPARDAEGFAQAFEARNTVTVRRNGRQWVPIEPLAPPPGATVLEGRGIRIAFDTAANGFGCLGIENRLGDEPAAFGHAAPGTAGFWTLTLWRDGCPANTCTLDNQSPCAERTAERLPRALRFTWKGLTPTNERGTVDVSATVTLTPEGDAAEWRLAVANRSTRWGLAQTQYPAISRVVRPGTASALLPTGNWGGRLMPNYARGERMGYPSGSVPVQTLSFLLGDAGLQFTALDGGSQAKQFDTTGLDLRIAYTCPDAGRPGAANAPDYAVETAAFTGGWWRAAKRYRAWATRQPWTAKGPLATRADFNRRIADVGFWMNAGNTPAQVTNAAAMALAALGDIPLGIHWYRWHQIPFDHTYPEYFPERPGMAEAVAWMKSRGVLVMPYINARLWDSEIPSFAAALPAACKKPDGASHYVEVYGSKRKLSPMCPATPLWRTRVNDICTELMERIGVNAIYLDQVAAARPAPCYDTSHGHPLGGGRYWTDAYRELMAPIRARAARNGNVVLTTECDAEPYIDSFDAFLAWFVRTPYDVPVLPAVYSGYTVYFSSPQSGADSLDAYCAMQGRDFLWGCQLGWNSGWPFDSKHKEHLAFTLRLCRERLAHTDFFVYGELLGEVPASADTPIVEGLWRRHSACRFRLPAAMGTLWRAPDGRRLACFVNVSGIARPFTYRLGDGPARTITLPPRSVKSILAP
ncbi:MAG: hypothetical protein IJ658_10250 [Kiritimatiellae bacterium]|nr:hypothetical protein [Kiritimatiellia bacterium]